MDELGIWVFSGTGNTLKCAEALHTKLEALGISAPVHRVEDGSEQAAEADLVLCYPIHGFNAPNPMLRFCRGLGRGSGRVWFLKTSGEPLRLNDDSSGELIRILRKQGRTVRGEFHCVMPYNMVFRHTDGTAALMWKTARERIPEAARQIAANTGPLPEPPLSARLMAGLCRIEHKFYPFNGRLFRVDEKRCLHCMRCVKDCPTGNIRYENGRFRFGGSCSGCARCAFTCPAGAIRIGLIDFMRVNGPYDFDADPAAASFGRYCRKAYERYFGESFPKKKEKE